MWMDLKSWSWVKNGKWAAQRVQSGRVKAKLGRKTKVCLPPHLTKQHVQQCVARHRVAWAWWQDLSLLGGLGAGKGGIELPHGPGHAVPGNA